MSQWEPLPLDQYRGLGSLVEQARPSVKVEDVLNAQIDPATGDVHGVVADSDGQKFNVRVFSGGVTVTPAARF